MKEQTRRKAEEEVRREVEEVAKKLGIEVNLEKPAHQCTSKRAWRQVVSA